MGLIINDKIQSLMVGYPTVSDKYNAKGGVLVGDPVAFGDLVGFSGTTGYYTKLTTVADAKSVAGIVLATNVKVGGIYPHSTANTLTYNGEAFNLLLDGFIAVELDNATVVAASTPEAKAAAVKAITDAIVEGAAANVDATNAKFSTTGTVDINATYTGIYEVIGDKITAEIRVK